MPLQTQNLVMVGLGVLGDIPPDTIQPRLVDGIHLRWAFRREKGFPWYGFYLFRRTHRSGSPEFSLRNTLEPLHPAVGSNSQWTMSDQHQVSSDQKLVLTDILIDGIPPSSSTHQIGLDLTKRSYLRFALPPGKVARQITVSIGFHERQGGALAGGSLRFSDEIQVTALSYTPKRGYVPVGQVSVKGNARQVGEASLEFDAISAVTLSQGAAALLDLRYVSVSQEEEDILREDHTNPWVPVADEPISLPLTHPDYPCTQGINEDLSRARATARQRIRYGDPNQFTSSPVSIPTSGTVSVSNGSPIVEGINTHWQLSLVGALLQISRDPTAYTIMMVVSPNKLVLSWSYAGTSRAGTTYILSQDTFGQFHDQLVHLVTGGSASGLMANRFIPVPISSGMAKVCKGDSTAWSTGMSWTGDLVGLIMEVVDREVTAGTVQVFSGSSNIIGTGTTWGADLVGLTFQIAGERTTYTVVHVHSLTHLQLNRGYIGATGGGRAYSIVEKTAYTITNINTITNVNPPMQQLILDRGYTGTTDELGTEKPYSIVGSIQPEELAKDVPLLPRLYPLDLALLGSLHPAVAQLLGLYWVDQTVETGVAYDYLIVTGVDNVKYSARQMLRWLQKNGFNKDVDGYIVFNKMKAPPAPLTPPDDLRVYALPGGSLRTQSGAINDETNNAGLRWNLGLTSSGALLPDYAVMYHVWRSSLGETLAGERNYELLTREQPVVVAETQRDPNTIPQYASTWPPFPLHYLDMGLSEGWYRYRVSGIDIFGRHSHNSAPSVWYEWTPMPVPRPWYYKDPPGNTVVHPSAVQLLNKLPPPPPTGIEAYALDPQDPTVLKDQAYKDWCQALSKEDWYRVLSEEDRKNLIGLRVRWQWPESLRRQAPDTREFRLYFHPGRMNAIEGKTISVSTVSNAQSKVETDIPNTQQAGAYAGAVLQIGANFFPIVDSEASNPLCLYVKNIGVLSPSQTVAVKKGSTDITGTGTWWGAELIGMLLQITGEQATYTIVQVDSPTHLTLDQAYTGDSGSGKTFLVFDTRPRVHVPCTITIPSSSVISTAGTISIAHGSSTVTGMGTNWRADFIGSRLYIEGDGTPHLVKRIDSPTQLTLAWPYTSSTASEKAYRLSRFTDFAVATSWQERYSVVGYDEHVTEDFTLANDSSGKDLQGSAATIASATTVSTIIKLDGNPDLSDLRLAGQQLLLEKDVNHPDKMYPISGIDDSAKTVTVDGIPNLNAVSSPWVIGWPLRRYEIFLPVPGDTFHDGLPLSTSLETPIVYAHIGVSAADGRTHTADAPQWAAGRWGNRFGNEGPVGPPTKIFRVRREAPDPPKPPPDSERVYASRADYHGHSFYTYRWRPGENLKTHIFRALDDTLFQVDWFIRTTRGSLDPSHRQHKVIFSALPEDWLPERKQAAADQLNAIASIEDYARLSQDAWDFMAFLPGNEGVKEMNALQQRDWQIRASRKSLTSEDQEMFPDEWKLTSDTLQMQQKRQIVATELNSIVSFTTYPTLSNDALRVLAGLPGNERAFTQLTIQPLDPNDPANADRKGPDSPNIYVPDTNLRAYQDTLDGRSTNRYFYHAAYVDSVHNRSELSLSSPPVWLPKVVPPRSPVITKVLGGDRQITLWWASNREPDLVEYCVYRADNELAARDVRLMMLVHTEAVATADSMARPEVVVWDDMNVGSGQPYWYRIVAVDSEGNVSLPTAPVKSQAYRYDAPPPPSWVSANWNTEQSAVNLEWAPLEPGLTYIIQRRSGESTRWQAISAWLSPDATTFSDRGASQTEGNYYRIKARDVAGNISVDYIPRLVSVPR